jgi:restriction system protein
LTIVEAIKKVLSEHINGLTFTSIYDEIVKAGLYDFGAIDPQSVVRSKLRQHCVGLDFPSASPTKHFLSDGNKGKSARYFIWDGKTKPSKSVNKDIEDKLPEEIIDVQHKEHLQTIKNQVMDLIYNADYGFFEHLVIKLLQKMGYGWDDKKSGVHTGGSKDRGIDGVIYLDQLGLDKVYIQAKRYNKSQKISSEQIQRFIGAMNTKGAAKGVFITSSYFTEDATQEANNAQLMKIALIDSEKLSELLITNKLGVNIVKVYSIYSVDADSFRDE